MPPRRRRQYAYRQYSEWERERHGIERGMPSPPVSTSVAADLIPTLLGEWGLEERAWLQTLEEEWIELVGQQVARHARPGRMDRGILFVFVSNSVWLSELKRHGELAMLDKLQSRFGEDKICGVQLRLDPDLVR